MYLLYSAKRTLLLSALTLLIVSAVTVDVTALTVRAEEPATQSDSASTGEVGDSTDATDPGDTPVTVTEENDGDPSTIGTGDADSRGDVGTTANTNETNTEGGTDVLIDNDNTADADNDLDVDAETGDNAAAGDAGAAVTTGNATASGNVVNVINTNVINANGLIYFLNVLFGHATFDMREMFSLFTGVPEGNGCSLSGCAGQDTTISITNQNVATVNNDVSVSAETGENSAQSETGTSSVSTGNAYASANVLNLVNTNIVDSNYLLLSINNFGDLMNDIVFPGADFFSEIFRSNSGITAGSNLTVTNTNTAHVENSVEVGAATGGNSASGTDSSITTGNAAAAATIVNQVNQNFLGDSLLFLFRIHGSWSGDVFGLPEGMAWRETDDGVELMFAPGGVAPSASDTTITNTNTATVTNNVSVFALTGDNEASGSAATITTGDAYASANVVNVVNNNIVGRNWVLAIFNIFGDWGGNISFGQPDLWVGARAVLPGTVRGGQCFTYEVTVNNFGDSAASNVRLSGIFDKAKQQFSQFDAELEDRLTWNIGRINAGGTRQLSIPVCLSSLVRGGETIGTGFVVDAHETDANTVDNSEELLFTAAGIPGGGVLRLGDSELSIEKTASKETMVASSSVEYVITIENKGDPVYNALLVDTIYNEAGKAIHEQRWGLETILANETIVVSYEAFFESSTTPGVYTNEAFISGVEHHPDFKNNYGSPIDSPVATVDVRIVSSLLEEEEVPVVAPTALCAPLLSTYIRPGAENDRGDVSKLQFFLRTHEEDTSVALTGTYDMVTELSVRSFQDKYRSEILTPWGAQQTTGYVYYTTQKKINELWCDREFPLSTTQQREIESFKSQIERYEAAGVPVPENDLREVGMNTDDLGTKLAAVTPSTVREEEMPEVTEVPPLDTQRDQLAGAAEAGRAAQGIFGQVRATVRSAFSWLGF